jgi:hypothetical protein
MQDGNELIQGNTGLFEDARQGAGLQFPMIWDNTAGSLASQDDMAAALPHDQKAQPLKGTDCLSP